MQKKQKKKFERPFPPTTPTKDTNLWYFWFPSVLGEEYR